jgi:hypothetical protein
MKEQSSSSSKSGKTGQVHDKAEYIRKQAEQLAQQQPQQPNDNENQSSTTTSKSTSSKSELLGVHNRERMQIKWLKVSLKHCC